VSLENAVNRLNEEIVKPDLEIVTTSGRKLGREAPDLRFFESENRSVKSNITYEYGQK